MESTKKRLFEILNKVNPELLLKEEINDAIKNPKFLPASLRRKINRELSNLPNYFNEVPFDKISDILKKYGIIPLQEDNTEWDGWFTGREGKAMITLGYLQTAYKGNNDITTYIPIENAALILTWYKMENSGKYEIVTYVS